MNPRTERTTLIHPGRRSLFYRATERLMTSNTTPISLVLCAPLYFMLRIVWDLPGEPRGELRDGLILGLFLVTTGVAIVLAVGAIVMTTRPNKKSE